jgi:hypothetical protein
MDFIKGLDKDVKGSFPKRVVSIFAVSRKKSNECWNFKENAFKQFGVYR